MADRPDRPAHAGGRRRSAPGPAAGVPPPLRADAVVLAGDLRRAERGLRALDGDGAVPLRHDLFVAIWLAWNTFADPSVQFDPRETNFTLLTLILSLQASYAAPLILLAQNRQADRDRVALEQDRARDERNLADTEFLTREVAALRIALRDMATRDFVRSELRQLLDEMEERGMTSARPASDDDGRR